MAGNVVEFSNTQSKECYISNSPQRCADERTLPSMTCRAEETKG
jgi:hypothetical protein